MGLADFIILGGIALIIAAAVYKLWRDKKKGASGCPGCAGCPYSRDCSSNSCSSSSSTSCH